MILRLNKKLFVALLAIGFLSPVSFAEDCGRALNDFSLKRVEGIKKDFEKFSENFIASVRKGDVGQKLEMSNRRLLERLSNIFDRAGLKKGRDFFVGEDPEIANSLAEGYGVTIKAEILRFNNLSHPFFAKIQSYLGNRPGALESLEVNFYRELVFQANGSFLPESKTMVLSLNETLALLKGMLTPTMRHELDHALDWSKLLNGVPGFYSFTFTADPRIAKLPGKGYAGLLSAGELSTHKRQPENERAFLIEQGGEGDQEKLVHSILKLVQRTDQFLEIEDLFEPLFDSIKGGKAPKDYLMSVEEFGAGVYRVKFEAEDSRAVNYDFSRGNKGYKTAQSAFVLSESYKGEVEKLVSNNPKVFSRMGDGGISEKLKMINQLAGVPVGQRDSAPEEFKKFFADYEKSGMAEIQSKLSAEILKLGLEVSAEFDLLIGKAQELKPLADRLEQAIEGSHDYKGRPNGNPIDLGAIKALTDRIYNL